MLLGLRTRAKARDELKAVPRPALVALLMGGIAVVLGVVWLAGTAYCEWPRPCCG